MPFGSASTAPDGGTLVNLLAQSESHADESGRHTIELEPYGYRWFRAGALNQARPGEQH